MNEDMRYMAQEFEEFLHKGHKLLEKMRGRQSMGERRGGYVRTGYRDNGADRWDGGSDMGERNWFGGGMGGYDPRYM